MWEQQDAPQLVRNRLRRVIANGDELVRAEMPAGWTYRDGAYVVVTGNGTPRPGRAVTGEQVHITVRSWDQPSARQLMTQIDGFLTMPGRFLGLALKPATGLISGPDSRLSCYYAAVTYRVDLPRKKA